MPTIAEELRAYRPTNEWGDPVHHTICDEAADVIDKLTAALEKASIAHEYDGVWPDQEIDAALSLVRQEGKG